MYGELGWISHPARLLTNAVLTEFVLQPATCNLQQNPTAFSLQLAAKLNNLLPSVAAIINALTLI
jgi:hypothetical protein